MVIFYTSVEGIEPAMLCYPYIVINPHSYYEALKYLDICADRVRSILIDTGVDKLFRRLGLRDYPRWYITQYVNMIRRVVDMYSGRTEILYVIPDIPVDYKGRERLYPWNVQRTVEYIELFRSKYIDLLRPAIPVAVVQGRKDDILSVIRTYEENEDLYNEFEIVGLGPTCHTKNWRKLAKMILGFDRIVKRPFHSFGAHLKAIKWVLSWGTKHFRSFDSSAYYYWSSRMVSGKSERTSALIQYLKKLSTIKSIQVIE